MGRSKHWKLLGWRPLLLGARTLLGAPGLTTRNKNLVGAPGIASRSKDAIRLEGPACSYEAPKSERRPFTIETEVKKKSAKKQGTMWRAKPES